LLLVTLLLMNAIAMEALPIFLEKLVPPAIAILVSVTLLLLFGEIIPQSLCNRFGLAIGAHLHWLVWFCIVISIPVSYPISKLLDCILGKDHGTFFKRAELKELVEIHGGTSNEGNQAGREKEEALTYDEIMIIKGAIDLKTKIVKDKITLLSECFMLEMNQVLNSETIQKIIAAGHSRIPIYSGYRENVVGMILTKSLILIDPQDELPISKANIIRVPMLQASMPLYDILDIFQKGHSHLAFAVSDVDNVTPLGIITLEDVIEELIQEDIIDETERDKVIQNEEEEATPIELEDTDSI